MIDFQDQIDFDYLYAEKINLSNIALFELTGEAEYDIVKSIREGYKQFGSFTEKQRVVLARFLAYKEL